MYTGHFALIEASWEKTWFRGGFQIVVLNIITSVVVAP